MAVSGLARLAISAPAAIYPVVGKDGLAAVEDLSLHPAVSLQPTPRHASVLLVSGEIRRGDHPALRRLHDQLPHPRATRPEEHTSELQSLMRISYAVFCL